MRIITALLAIFFLSIISNAKTGSISGTVTDAQSGETLLGANVLVENTNYGAATDANGFFEIKKLLPGIYNVKISYIGYQPLKIEKVKVESNKTTTLTIALTPEELQLQELTITTPMPLIKKDVTTASKMTIGQQISGSYSTQYPPQDYNTEEYQYVDESDFRDVSKSPLSTFSIDVDAASYSNTRRFLMSGQLPPKDAVRVEEFINYFDYDYPQPENGLPFGITLEYSQCPWNKDNNLVHIGIKGKDLVKKELLTNNLTFLIDVSGSMESPDKLPLLKRAFKMLVEQLSPQDRIAIVVYASSEGLALPSTKGTEKSEILDAIENLHAGGSTAGGAGIKLAYKTAKENFIKGGNNRVILATDGDFNVGISSTSELVRFLEEQRNTGIFLSVLGFGDGNLKDSRMEDLADKGNGNYSYIDNILEAKKVLVDELGSTLYTIAKDVKIQVEFNPTKVKSYRLIGYENRMLNAEDFENDKKDAGEIGAGHTVTALYEIVPGSAEDNSSDLKYQENKIKNGAKNSDELLTVNIRYKDPDKDESKLVSRALINNPVELDDASDDYKFSASVAAFGMLLRDSKYKSGATFDNVKKLAENSKGSDENGYRSEFIRLVDLAEELMRNKPIPN